MRLRGVPRAVYQLRYVLEAVLLLGAGLVLLSPRSSHPTYNNMIIAEDQSSDRHRDVLRTSTTEDDMLFLPPEDVADDSYWSHTHQLVEGLVPPNVYYYWCGKKRTFEFKHYLSVLSVIRALRPDKIIFHHEEPPILDRHMYHYWFEQLKKDVEFFEPRQMSGPIVTAFCHGQRVDKMGVILGKLTQNGGVYLSENTWIRELTPAMRRADLDLSISQDNAAEGYVMMRGGLMTPGTTLGDIKRNTSLNTRQGSCSPMRYLLSGGAGNCVIAKGGEFEKIFPIKVIYRDDPFGALVRQLYYGSPAMRRAEPSYDVLVPNIGHMIWIGGGKMSYVFYLSLLSLLYVVKVDVVYIHGDAPPQGEHWESLCREPRIRDRIKLIARTAPTSVYQGPIEPYYRALMSDIIRVDLMLKFGGIYTDTDAIWVKPLSREDRGYEAVAAYDWVDWTRPFPDVVNFGVSYGKRNAPFWRVFRESMRELHNDMPGHTGVAVPYKLYERHPDLLRIDKRLSVICYYDKCHPLWVNNYHNGSNNHITTGSIKNWRTDVHAFHWTYPDPTELHNRTILLQSKGMFAEIGKFVLQAAGLL